MSDIFSSKEPPKNEQTQIRELPCEQLDQVAGGVSFATAVVAQPRLRLLHLPQLIQWDRPTF